MDYLVSDDETITDAGANAGLTLPTESDATHNIALSPLFMISNGYGSARDYTLALTHRGDIGYLWSNISRANIDDWAYYLAYSNIVTPSSNNGRMFSQSLRCLISTKRQASE